MDENEMIDEIKEKLLKEVNDTLKYINVYKTEVNEHDVQRSIIIKNLVDSYDVLNNLQEEI